jgi:hypothetical protein
MSDAGPPSGYGRSGLVPRLRRQSDDHLPPHQIQLPLRRFLGPRSTAARMVLTSLVYLRAASSRAILTSLGTIDGSSDKLIKCAVPKFVNQTASVNLGARKFGMMTTRASTPLSRGLLRGLIRHPRFNRLKSDSYLPTWRREWNLKPRP